MEAENLKPTTRFLEWTGLKKWFIEEIGIRAPSAMTLKRWEKSCGFPHRAYFSQQRPVWKVEDLENWVESILNDRPSTRWKSQKEIQKEIELLKKVVK